MAIVIYLFRRAVRHWPLFLNLSLGIVLATALLASAPPLVDTVLEIGLRQRILAAGAPDRNLFLQTYALTEAPAIEALDRQARRWLDRWLGSCVERTILSAYSTWMIPWGADGELLSADRVNLSFQDGIQQHVEFVAGSWPSEGSWPAEEGVLADAVPVVIGESMAREYELEVGDCLPVSLRGDASSPFQRLQVSGIVRPRDPGDGYWLVDMHPLQDQGGEQQSRRYSAILPAGSFYHAVATLLPGTKSRVTWTVQLDPGQITVAGTYDLRGRIAALKRDLYVDQLRILLTSGLDTLLADFAVQAEAVRGPLYLLISEITFLVLYYVVLVAALSTQQAEREFAVLLGRGATGRQIFAIQAVEAILIAAIALVSGPGLANLFLRGLVRLGPLADVVHRDWIAALVPASWFAAALGAVVCIVGLLLPVRPALRRSILAHRQRLTRPPRAPWWQRLYLDVILLLIGLVLLWRLYLYGGVVAGSTSRPQVDWLLLLSPLVLLLGSATILLRVLPLLLRLFAYVVAQRRGLSVALALWQVSRTPIQGVLLVLLLTLATSLGMLSAGLNATLDVSERERAQYAVGGDMRLIAADIVDLAGLAGEPGVRAVTGLVRERGTLDLGSFRLFPHFQVLAVDPLALAQVGRFRDDFASLPMERLLHQIVPGEDVADPSLPLPGQPSSLGIWMWSPKDSQRPGYRYAAGYYVGESDLDRIALRARLRTGRGVYLNVTLESPGPGACPFDCCLDCCADGAGATQNGSALCGWRYVSGQLPDLGAGSYPLWLHSVWIQNRTQVARDGSTTWAAIDIAMDDLTVSDGETEDVQVVEDFEDPAQAWHSDWLDAQTSRDTTTAHSGQASQRLVLDFVQPFEWAGWRPAPIDLDGAPNESDGAPIELDGALPILASPAFLRTAHLQVGDTALAWIRSAHFPLRVVGAVDYFPTMVEDPAVLEAGFVIMARDPLLVQANGSNAKPINVNEGWLFADSPISTDRVTTLAHGVDEIWETEAVRNAIKADPMALGLRSVCVYGYLLTSLLSVVGFVTTFYMSARRREMTYGVLRTMGLSPGQLYASLIVEQVVLIVAGMALGSLLGAILNSLVLPGLPVTLGKLPPVPPFRAHTDWVAVGRIYLALGGALLACLTVATALLWRARIHRVLRIGEE